MNTEQAKSLLQLSLALKAATASGYLEELNANLHPGRINEFCDAVSDEITAHNLRLVDGFLGSRQEQGFARNTKIVYSYTDGNNFSTTKEVVLAGEESIDRLIAVCGSFDRENDHDDFIPGLTGLPDLQLAMRGGFDPEVDHPFHRLERLEATAELPTVFEQGLDGHQGFIDANHFCELLVRHGGPQGKDWPKGYVPGQDPSQIPRMRS